MSTAFIAAVLAHPVWSAVLATLGLLAVIWYDDRVEGRRRAPATRAHQTPEPPEFDEPLGPIIPDCENPLGCECYRKGLRTHAERAGCQFRGIA